MSYSIKLNVASTHDTEVCRVVLFEQIRNDVGAALPTAASILATVNPYSYQNQTLSRQRYRILFDRVHVLNRFVTALDTNTRVFKYSKNLKGRKMVFNSATPVPATGVGGESNQIFILVISDAAANEAILTGATQYIYTDQ